MESLATPHADAVGGTVQLHLISASIHTYVCKIYLPLHIHCPSCGAVMRCNAVQQLPLPRSSTTATATTSPFPLSPPPPLSEEGGGGESGRGIYVRAPSVCMHELSVSVSVSSTFFLSLNYSKKYLKLCLMQSTEHGAQHRPGRQARPIQYTNKHNQG